jgi:glycosyltransferase involved in cell wall biosynthesis
VGLTAALLARRHRAPFVLDVRDLWPAAALAVGELSDGFGLAVAEGLEQFLYRDAAAITTVTDPFVDHIEAHGGNGKVQLVRNGTTRFWLESANLEPDRDGSDLPEQEFIWTFAGNLGLAQGLESAVKAAALLGPGFRLLLVGDGAEKRALEDLARDLAPSFVEFREQVPQEEAARLLRASDALLVSLGAHPGLAPFVPSKLFDFCAVGRPVVLAAAGEASRLVEEDGAALAVPPGEPEALATAIRSIRDSSALASSLVTAGRDFAERNLREDGVSAVAELLDAVGTRATA